MTWRAFSAKARILRSLLILSVALLSRTLHAQLEHYGLSGRTVNSLAEYGGKIYAGTDTGVYVRSLFLSDTAWVLAGLSGKIVRSIYPHPFGAIGYAVTAGVERRPGDPDSGLIYCSRYSDTAWAEVDSGIDRAHIGKIQSIHGFFSPAVCGETFAAGDGLVYRRSSDLWDRVFASDVGAVYVVRADDRNASVWIGGEEYPADTSVAYGGMEGTVIKSTDGGGHWSTTGLKTTSHTFCALVIDAFTRTIFAGGSTTPDTFILYKSPDAGGTWSEFIPTVPLAGIRSLAIMPTLIPELNYLLIGTAGNGVLRVAILHTSVGRTSTREDVHLEQNFPNPFNPTTVISYEISGVCGQPSVVSLMVFDLLGREVKTLIDELKYPGRYTATWNATDCSSGVYFYRLTAGKFSQSKMLLLLK